MQDLVHEAIAAREGDTQRYMWILHTDESLARVYAAPLVTQMQEGVVTAYCPGMDLLRDDRDLLGAQLRRREPRVVQSGLRRVHIAQIAATVHYRVALDG